MAITNPAPFLHEHKYMRFRFQNHRRRRESNLYPIKSLRQRKHHIRHIVVWRLLTLVFNVNTINIVRVRSCEQRAQRGVFVRENIKPPATIEGRKIPFTE